MIKPCLSFKMTTALSTSAGTSSGCSKSASMSAFLYIGSLAFAVAFFSALKNLPTSPVLTGLGLVDILNLSAKWSE